MSKKPNLKKLEDEIWLPKWCPYCTKGGHKLILYEDIDDKKVKYFIGKCETTGKDIILKANVVDVVI